MTREILHLPPVANRVESGAIQFGDDWPGYFMRGDDACYMAMCIKMTLDRLPHDDIYSRQLRDLVDRITQNTDLTSNASR